MTLPPLPEAVAAHGWAALGWDGTGVLLGLAVGAGVWLVVALVRRSRSLRSAAGPTARFTQLRHDALINATLESVITVDAAQRVVLFNPAAQRLFGCSEEEALGADLGRFLPAAVREAHRRHVETFGDSPVGERLMAPTREVCGLRTNGEEFPVEASISQVSMPAGPGRPAQRYFTVLLRDITERRRVLQAQADLQRLQQRYRTIVEQSPSAICIIEGDHITLANRACLELFGVPAGMELVGLSPAALFPPAMCEVLARGPVPEGTTLLLGEQPIQRQDGQQREVEAWGAAVPDHGQPALQLVLRDVTERNHNARLLRASRSELRRLSRNLIQVREEERKRIARELHDELGQRLSAIKMRIASLARNDAAALRDHQQQLVEAVTMVDELVSSVRRIAADLRPAMLDDLGLAAAIDWLAADCAAQSGLHVVAHCDTQDEGMADEARTAAYRVVQEALTNIRRHASARRVDIDVHSSEQELMVRVTDDGVGMAPQSANKRGSYGLVGMRERARQLGGGLHVGAGPTGGTRIEWRIPLVTDAPDHDTTTIPALL